MKNDMRITYPLWMMWFLLLIAATIYLVGTTAVIQESGTGEVTFILNLESKLIFFFKFVCSVNWQCDHLYY